MTGPRRPAVPCCSECASDCCGEGSSGTGCPSTYATSVTFSYANIFAAGTYTATSSTGGCGFVLDGTFDDDQHCCNIVDADPGLTCAEWCGDCPECDTKCTDGGLTIQQKWSVGIDTGASSACSLIYDVRFGLYSYLGIGGSVYWDWTVEKSGCCSCLAVASTNPIVSAPTLTSSGGVGDCFDWESLGAPSWSIS